MTFPSKPKSYAEVKQDLVQQITPHQQHLKKMIGWEAYRKEHPELELPHSNTLRKYFGSWYKVKELFDLNPKTNKKVSRKGWPEKPLNEVIELLKPHVFALEGSPRNWDEYRRTKKLTKALPGSFMIIYIFGSWNEMKKVFSLETKESKRKHDYTTEQIREIVEKYAPDVFRARSWERFRKEHPTLSLPTYMTILNYISKEELAEYEWKWEQPSKNRKNGGNVNGE